MTDTTAVLVTVYLGLIESEDDAQLGHWDPAHHVRCHRLLAAEVRALREKSRDEEESLLRQVYRVCDELEKAKAQVAALREKLALQEPDATLGRLVREMPEGTDLHHNCNGYDEWSAENVRGEYNWEPTPEQALGRLGPRCGDCALRVESGPLAGECHYDPDPRIENAACEWFEEREVLK